MIPGPDIVIECPDCSALARVFSLTSGNTFGAVLWSDGKLIAPMLPEPPEITRCQTCEAIFWVSDAREVGRFTPWNLDEAEIEPEWLSAPRIEEMSVEDHFHALKGGLAATPEREKQLRILTWWRGNDPLRIDESGGQAADDGLSPEAVSNLRSLSSLLDDEIQEEKLMKAEIARDLGDFPAALELLQEVTEESLRSARDQIETLCKAGIREVEKIGT